MIVILLNWMYAFLTMGIVGGFLLRRIYKFCGYRGKVPFVSKLVLGVGAVTAYAGYFSIFTGVGAIANLILLVICMVMLHIDRKKILNETLAGVKDTPGWYYAIYAVIFAGCLYFTAYGSFMYDTGLYHAQAIRWIEEYGCVRGQAFVHERFGYNSSFFCLCALYSMKSVLGQSLHTLSGFMAGIVMCYSAGGFLQGIRMKRRWICPANFVRLGPFIYFIIVCQELISPTTDFATVFLIMWLVIRWVELLEENAPVEPYCMLCVISVFLISLKLSTGILVLLVIYPAVSLVRDKRWREIGLFIAMGLFVLLPYLIRNIIITGWLVYPFSAIDLFDVDWKLAKETLDGDSADITVYARRVYDRSLRDQSIFEWFPVWWREQGTLYRYYTVFAFAGIGLEALHVVFELIKYVKRKNREWFPYAYINLIMIACFLFWLFSAPLHRYGFAFVLMMPLVAIGSLFYRKEEPGVVLAAMGAVSACALLFMVRPSAEIMRSDISYIQNTLNGDYVRWQKDYPKADVEAGSVNGITVYYPKEPGGQSWYQDFPAAPFGENLIYWEARGETIKEGFRAKE
ncbi:hypothetical protein D7X88_08935 [bacterium C-53]|nr:hypothetical protein [Lachnospiraceae bacterium]NBI03163.1 hypothetical protein [Lachnospiraceae bacterium]RKJ10057.1 hypothetical protein D7X88_08935 [bacterium C-53]